MIRKIYKEDLDFIFECLNEGVKKKRSVLDVLSEKGCVILPRANETASDIIGIRAFIPRYLYLLKKEKKKSGDIIKFKKIVNDFISKYKVNK